MSMKIVWIGCHSEGVDAFKSILESGWKIDRFITLDDDSFQKRSSGTREYVELCREFHIPVKLISTIKNEDAYNKIAEAKPDLLIVLGWSEILPERLLDVPTIGTVGAHASMLPHNRGSAPVNWALIKGEKTGGNSLMWLDKEVDRGEIIDQMSFDIDVYDTCKTLYDKVAGTNKIMLLRLIDRLSRNQNTVISKKNVSDEPLLPRRRPKDGLICWDKSGMEIYNFIRALTKPYPGAFSYIEGRKMLIWSASVLPDTEEKGVPGEIIGNVYSPVPAACGIMVQCGKGRIILHELEDEQGRTYTGKGIAEMNITGRFEGESI